MKTVQIGFINSRFDEQYTFELQGYVCVNNTHGSNQIMHASDSIYVVAIAINARFPHGHTPDQ